MDKSKVLVIYQLDKPAFPVSAELIPVFACESGFDPTAVSNTNDFGIAQINKGAHLQEMLARKLAWTERDRLIFAEQMLKEQGLKPWESSKSCWEGK